MTDLIAEDLAALPPSHRIGAARDGACTRDLNIFSARNKASFPRPRLAFRAAAGPHRLTIIEAPSGYGKSCLLNQWAADLAGHGLRTLLVEIHRDNIAIAHLADEPNTSTLVPTRDSLGDVVHQWLERDPKGTVLIDDWHRLNTKSAKELLDTFSNAKFAHGRLALATNRPLQQTLARARAFGQVRDIDAMSLRFTPDEVQSFIALKTGIQSDHEQLGKIVDISEGWPAALCVLASRIAQVGLPALLEDPALTSGLMDDFFAEEIVDRLSSRIRNFLCRASVIGTLDDDVCNAILGIDNSADLVNDIVRAGLFVERADKQLGGYRLHRLFEHYLQSRFRRLDRKSHDAVAIDASRWFEHNGRLKDAFDCATRARAWTRAAQILERYCVPAYKRGKGKQLTSMALSLPRSVLQQHPRIAIFAARAASTLRRYGLVDDLLQLAEAPADLKGEASAESTELEYLALHIRMFAAQFEDNHRDAGRICERLLAYPQYFDHYARGTIYGSLLYARREQFNFADASHLEAAGVREFDRSESPYGMVWHLSVVGPTRALAGDLDGSIRQLEEALKIASGLTETKWLATLPGALLAECYYERNELDRCRDLLDRQFPAMPNGFVDQYIAAYLTSAKLHLLTGDVRTAHQWIDRGMAVAETRAMDRLRDSLIGERIRILLHLGQTEEALALGQREDLLEDPAALAPRSDSTTRDEVRATSWVRLAIAHGRLSDAVAHAKRWKRHVASARAIRSMIRWDILLAQIYLRQGSADNAQRTLRSALTQAAPAAYTRSFLDEGTAIRGLLQAQLDASPIQSSIADQFLLKLIGTDCINRSRAHVLANEIVDQLGSATIRPLTPRQIDILQMASAGVRNGEIATRIGISEGSVKWHLQQIYDKIGIRRRAGALERARKLGILPCA